MWGCWYVSRHPIIASVVFGSSRLPRPTSDYRIGRVLIVSAARYSLSQYEHHLMTLISGNISDKQSAFPYSGTDVVCSLSLYSNITYTVLVTLSSRPIVETHVLLERKAWKETHVATTSSRLVWFRTSNNLRTYGNQLCFQQRIRQLNTRNQRAELLWTWIPD